MVSLTIIVPTYNEAENIPQLVSRIRRSLNGTTTYDILVMDDSPTDETVRVAREHGCKAVHRTTDKGLAPAVIEGIGIAKTWGAGYVVVMDADLQHPPEVLPELLEALRNHDFVVPSRYVRNGGCSNWSLGRRLISRGASLLAMPLVSFKLRDTSSGFFGFRASALQTLEGLEGRGFKIMLELLVKGNWKSVKEIPYIFETRKRGESKLSQATMVAYLHQLLALYLYRVRQLLTRPILHYSNLTLSKAFRFLLAGSGGASIAFTLTYVLTEYANLWYMLSLVIGTGLGTIFNFVVNAIWTFRENK